MSNHFLQVINVLLRSQIKETSQSIQEVYKWGQNNQSLKLHKSNKSKI